MTRGDLMVIHYTRPIHYLNVGVPPVLKTPSVNIMHRPDPAAFHGHVLSALIGHLYCLPTKRGCLGGGEGGGRGGGGYSRSSIQ